MAYLSKISITDDFMFATVLKNNKEACKKITGGDNVIAKDAKAIIFEAKNVDTICGVEIQ